MKVRTRKARLARGLVLAIILWLTTLWLVPEGYTFYMSTTEARPALSGGGVYLTAGSFVTAFQVPGLTRFFLNSVLITAATVALVTIAASSAGYAISRLRFPGAKTLYAVLLLGLMLPETAFAVPFYQLVKDLHLLNNYLGLIIPYSAMFTPFALVIYKSFFDDFPVEIEEAAWVDGASQLAALRRIVLPNFIPATIVVVIFTFLGSWNEFLLALIVMTSNSMKTIALAPLVFEGPYGGQEGVLIAALVIVSLPIVVVYFALQRYIEFGVSSGAAKG